MVGVLWAEVTIERTELVRVSPAPAVLVACLLVAVVLIAALVMTAAQNRRREAETRPRVCRSCVLSHPPFAEYCGRCGRKL